MIFDHRRCELGEGAFWHPERGQLFWFDILNRMLLSVDATGQRHWVFDRMVSACGWLDRDSLLIGSETGLLRFDIDSGATQVIAAIEADRPGNRSNDGRADRQGGFWLGTMGKEPTPGLGAIWRWYKGELRRLFTGLFIPNSIAFTPDGKVAQFSDTPTGKVWRVALDSEGWPRGKPELWQDHSPAMIYPDGSVFDGEGRLWQAQWGQGRVVVYGPDGALLRTVPVCGPHSSCPAFGGAGLTTLYCTTALEHMSQADRAAQPDAGKVFHLPNAGKGLAEPRILT
jgi:sugar lactone lactonase YvrE